MGARPRGQRSEKEIAADERRKAWWTEERRAAKSKERSERNKQDWFRQLVSNGWRRCKRSKRRIR